MVMFADTVFAFTRQGDKLNSVVVYDWYPQKKGRTALTKKFFPDGKPEKEEFGESLFLGPHSKEYSPEGRLLTERYNFRKQMDLCFCYDSEGCLAVMSEYTPGRRKLTFFNKGIQTQQSTALCDGHKWTDEFSGKETTKFYDKRREVIQRIDTVKKGKMQVEYCYDVNYKKSPLKECKITAKKGNQCTQTTYNSRGEIVKQKIQMGADKCVEIEPNRSLWKKIWDARKEGATFGQVKRVVLSEKRSKVNADLKAIWASQLSPEAKKEKLRKVAAAFRVAQGKAPNPQVYKKLVKIHQQER